MRKIAIFCLVVAFIAFSANAQERNPVAISPGSDAGIASVGTSCPTFSWTGMDWATGYRVVVFETTGPNVLAYKEMEAITSPILSKEIQGRALSWTPSSDERLSSGSMYVWFVEAVDSYGTGMWSEGQVFKVEVEVQLFGIEESIRKSLAEHGVSEEAIEEALADMKFGMKELVAIGIETKSIVDEAQDDVRIQGLEDTFNTFYGEEAGFYISSGLCNSFFGRRAGYLTSNGYNNTFVGHSAGYYNTSGSFNTFIGYHTGEDNTTGDYNTFMGDHAGDNNTSGDSNTFIGSCAGTQNNIGHSNTFIGYHAGNNNISGYANTSVGNRAGALNFSGSGNVFLGDHAGYSEAGSNRLYIDNSDTSTPLIWGNFSGNILTVHGKLGIGTKSPAYAIELETSGTNAAFVAQRTDGATNYINATAGFGNFGTVTNHPLRLAVNSVWRMRLDNDNSLTMANGAICTAGGTWQNYSRREAKENIHDLTAEEAMDTLGGLVAVKYNYKVDKEEKHVGFIAEDVPGLVASKDRNGISAMDIVAVLTKVVQEQQEMIKKQQDVAQEQENQDREQQEIIDKFQERIAELQKQIDELKNKEK